MPCIGTANLDKDAGKGYIYLHYLGQNIEILRKLLDFRFRRHPRFNWEKRRLTMVEKMVSERAREILE